MPIRPPLHPPQNQRDWNAWAGSVPVQPDDNTVGTAQLVNSAVTYAKIQNVAATSLIGNSTNAAGIAQQIEIGGGLDFSSTNLERSALTGDVTASAGSDATSITAASVTYAKIQHVTTGTLLGRSTAGVGSAEEIAVESPLLIATDQLSIDLTKVAAKSTGTYTGSMTGVTVDPAPVIVYSIAGSVVVLNIPNGTTATSNATSMTITGAPSAIRPTRAQPMVCRVEDSGTPAVGIATMDSSGVITFGLGMSGAAFTSTGTKGASGIFTYSLD